MRDDITEECKTCNHYIGYDQECIRCGVNDQAIIDYQRERIALLEAAIRKHRGDVRASNAYGWPEDNELYAVLQEDKP